MAEARFERRLAAVLAADVAEYSRLMGGDEEGTLAASRYADVTFSIRTSWRIAVA
jgi:class 3 adenylate cyclase